MESEESYFVTLEKYHSKNRQTKAVIEYALQQRNTLILGGASFEKFKQDIRSKLAEINATYAKQTPQALYEQELYDASGYNLIITSEESRYASEITCTMLAKKVAKTIIVEPDGGC